MVVDKIAHPALYEGFPVGLTKHTPSGIYTTNSMRKIIKKKKTTSQLDKKNFHLRLIQESIYLQTFHKFPSKFSRFGLNFNAVFFQSAFLSFSNFRVVF